MLHSICPIQLQHRDMARWVHLLELTPWVVIWVVDVNVDRHVWQYSFRAAMHSAYYNVLPFSPPIVSDTLTIIPWYICLAIWFPGPVSGVNTLSAIMHPITPGMYHYPIVSSAVGKVSIVQIDLDIPQLGPLPTQLGSCCSSTHSCTSVKLP